MLDIDALRSLHESLATETEDVTLQSGRTDQIPICEVSIYFLSARATSVERIIALCTRGLPRKWTITQHGRFTGLYSFQVSRFVCTARFAIKEEEEEEEDNNLQCHFLLSLFFSLRLSEYFSLVCFVINLAFFYCQCSTLQYAYQISQFTKNAMYLLYSRIWHHKLACIVPVVTGRIVTLWNCGKASNRKTSNFFFFTSKVLRRKFYPELRLVAKNIVQ